MNEEASCSARENQSIKPGERGGSAANRLSSIETQMRPQNLTSVGLPKNCINQYINKITYGDDIDSEFSESLANLYRPVPSIAPCFETVIQHDSEFSEQELNQSVCSDYLILSPRQSAVDSIPAAPGVYMPPSELVQPRNVASLNGSPAGSDVAHDCLGESPANQVAIIANHLVSPTKRHDSCRSQCLCQSRSSSGCFDAAYSMSLSAANRHRTQEVKGEVQVVNLSSTVIPARRRPDPVNSSLLNNWQCSKASVKDRVAYLYNSRTLSDVTFVLGKSPHEQEIPAHKFVLSMSSVVFDLMFNGMMASTMTSLASNAVIDLPDVEPQIFLTFLRYLYTDDICLDHENVMQIFYVAKKYLIIPLEQSCVNFLHQNLSCENAFMLLTQARLFDSPQLEKFCLEAIDKNTFDVLQTDEFLEIDMSTLRVVLARDSLGIKETKLFAAVLRWAFAECHRRNISATAENQRLVIGSALQLVRFPTMTIEEFSVHVAQTGILTDSELVQMYLHFTINPKPATPYVDLPRCCLTGKEQTISRFYQVESRWGYSGTSDRIRFMVSRRIYVVGFGLYGGIQGASEYSVNIQMIQTDKGKICGQNNCIFHCDRSSSTFRVMFKEPIEVHPNINYTACATLKGPDSFYGTRGLRKVVHDSLNAGKITFQFSYAAGNNNGTSVEDGQIPELIFYT